MCGLTGFWNFSQDFSKEKLSSVISNMALAIEARGPDSEGIWVDEKIGLGLGHRRLAIVDLSPAGHQPMASKSDRFVIIYNGEIYNTEDLRKELIQAGCQFRGYSDTEVILEASEHWGVAKTAAKLNGIFSFALWDKQEKKLYLVRDRLGVKPLYWGFNQGILFFGSQLKSFLKHPHWNGALDKSALCAYFRFNYVPAPLSIFQGIQKLKPGVVLSLDQSKKITEEKFWDLETLVEKGQSQTSQKSDKIWIDELDDLLRDSVKRQMVADVPLGAFLSGGIDSSMVVALMQAQSTRPIRTFSIGFHEAEYNEAQYAAKVAKHLGTEHHELYLSAKDAMDIIPNIPEWCDEPFADVSQIPTFLVSQLARRHVTVSLSGDGGDELFAGYNRYLMGQNIWQKMKYLPLWLRALGASGIRQFSVTSWDTFAKMVPAQLRPRLMGDKIYKLAAVLKATNPQDFYRLLVSQWNDPAALVLGEQEPKLYPWNSDFYEKFPGDFVNNMRTMDLLTYLPDDILAKVDRASMAVSLEARVPLLDHRLVEFSTTLPMEMKIRQGQGKWILRQVLNRYIPEQLFNRPKMGFGVPVGDWLKGPLREWAESLLSSERLKKEGILNEKPIRQRWLEHCSGKRNWQYSLWGVLMFQAWQERWME